MIRPFFSASLTAGLLLGAAAFPADAAGQEPTRITGAWRVLEITRADDSKGPRKQAAQPGLYLFTARYYSITRVDGDKPRPDFPGELARTSDTYREVWGPFAAQAGTYELRGDRLVTRPQVSKNPAGMQTNNMRTYSVRIVADTLWLQVVQDNTGEVRDADLYKLVRAEQ